MFRYLLAKKLLVLKNISAFGIQLDSLRIPEKFNANKPFLFILKKGEHLLFEGVFVE